MDCEPVEVTIAEQIPPDRSTPLLRGNGHSNVGEHSGSAQLHIREVAHEGGQSVSSGQGVHLPVGVISVPCHVEKGVRMGIVDSSNTIVGNLE